MREGNVKLSDRISVRIIAARSLLFTVFAAAVLLLSGCAEKEPAGSETQRSYDTAVTEPTVSNETAAKTQPVINTDWGSEVKGELIDNVYTTGMGGFKLTLDESWNCLSEEEMAKTMHFDVMENDIQEWYDYCVGEMNTLYDLWAICEDGSSIIISIENVSMTDSETKKDEEAYAGILQIAMRREMDKFGISKSGSVKVSGSDCFWTTMYGKQGGRSVERGYLLKMSDDYMMCVNITSVAESEKSCDEMLCMFEGVEGLEALDSGVSE